VFLNGAGCSRKGEKMCKTTQEESSQKRKGQMVLKGQRFADLSDIQRNVKTLLRGIPENDFHDCFRQWHHRLTKCIASQGEYFEGDSSR